MDHYLHAPGSLVRRVGERIRSRVGVPAASPRRIYLSRRGDGKRVMVNEAALEACLEDRGFVVVKPETLGPGDQARLVHDAEVIVSATGAGLTNCLFAPAGCKVFEIQPINFTGIWVWSLCEELEQEWYGYFCPSPIEAHTAVVGGVDYTNVLFSYELPLTDFLGFLDERL